ncbi:unnamed protein product [Lathyrus oleraceus]
MQIEARERRLNAIEAATEIDCSEVGESNLRLLECELSKGEEKMVIMHEFWNHEKLKKWRTKKLMILRKSFFSLSDEGRAYA